MISLRPLTHYWLTAVCAPLLLLCVSAAHAQETNYWTHALGTRSALMGGAVVAGVRDNSAIWYNPGALGFITNPSLSISANAYQVNRLRLPNGAGNNQDLKSSQIQTLPLLIGGVKKIKLLPRAVFGYGLITRAQSATSASARSEQLLSVFTVPADSLQEYLGFVQYRNVHRDLSGVATLGWQLTRRIKSRLALGVSMYVGARIINYGYELSAQALPSNAPRGPFSYLAAVSTRESFDLTTFRLDWRVGLAYEVGSWRLGLTVTTPSISLGGTAVVSREILLSNLYRSLPMGQRLPYLDALASDRQEDLEARWHAPLSIALGVERRFARWTVGLSAEWFNAVKLYDVVTPVSRQFLRPSTVNYPIPTDDFLKVTSANTSVLNWALGIEYNLSDPVLLYASYRTDFSYFSNRSAPVSTSAGRALGLPSTIGAARLGIDLQHLAAGITLRRDRSDLSLGFTYGFGRRRNTLQLANMSNPTDRGFLFSPQTEVGVSYQSFGLIVGITHRLSRSYDS